jgi:hypothetical protein
LCHRKSLLKILYHCQHGHCGPSMRSSCKWTKSKRCVLGRRTQPPRRCVSCTVVLRCQTTPYGREGQYRVLVLVGNGHGAAGYGVGAHKDVDIATKYALRKATRDMVALGSHNGQLYHDLMGKKNNHKVLIRSCTQACARVLFVRCADSEWCLWCVCVCVCQCRRASQVRPP